MKLTKISSTEWLGNGLGTTGATYSVVGYPEITITPASGRWLVEAPGVRRFWDSFKFAKEHAAELIN